MHNERISRLSGPNRLLDNNEDTLLHHPLNTELRYIIPVPDGEPQQASPLQGFALSLCFNSGLMRLAAQLPSNVFDLSDDGRGSFAARRICGVNSINALPMSPRAIRFVPLPAYAPFNVLLLPKEEEAADYRFWAKSSSISPLMVAHSGGDVTYRDLSTEVLRAFCIRVCDQLSGHVEDQQIDDVRRALQEWAEPEVQELDYKVDGHATIAPNLQVLRAFGYHNMGADPFKAIGDGTAPYVKQIVATSRTVLSERRAVDTSAGVGEYPHTPDIILLAPAMYTHVATMTAPGELVGSEKRAYFTVRDALVQQKGYGFSARTEHQAEVLFGAKMGEIRDGTAKPIPHPLMRIRQLELSLLTAAVGVFAASTLSATIRLPNSVNTVFRTVRSFADGYRSSETSSKKRLEGFRLAQAAIKNAVPVDFLPLLRSSQDGVRIIADAHLEWLDVDGLPLSIQKNTSRLSVTPGNLLIDQLAPHPLIHLTPGSFNKVLILSALKRTDPIRGMFDLAFEGFGKHWADRLEIEVVEIANSSDLVAALNEFEGPLVIFDGHGSHRENQAAVLHLHDEFCDVWSLRDLISRPPPIVILSACDTHAAARNHATVANGFLALGSRAVLGSVFPLDARDAAIFAARLLFRISDFIPSAISVFGRALTWTEIVSGMLRMQLLTDFLRLLLREGMISDEAYVEVHQKGNYAINFGRASPFDDVIGLLEEVGVMRDTAKAKLELALANSTVLAYLNIGRPETILIGAEDEDDLSERSYVE